MHEFVFVTFGGHELNYVTGQHGPDYCFYINFCPCLCFFESKLQANWRHLWADYRLYGKMSRPAGRTPRPNA
jgi:hypothetical protein